MSSKELRNQSFPTNTITEWQEKQRNHLRENRSNPYSETTYENIILKPLYSREDVTSNLRISCRVLILGGGYHPSGIPHNDWKVSPEDFLSMQEKN